MAKNSWPKRKGGNPMTDVRRGYELLTAVAIAKCVACGVRREIHAGAIAPGDQPMCEAFGSPMIATRLTVTVR
jgi:hypothetical protein